MSRKQSLIPRNQGGPWKAAVRLPDLAKAIAVTLIATFALTELVIIDSVKEAQPVKEKRSELSGAGSATKIANHPIQSAGDEAKIPSAQTYRITDPETGRTITIEAERPPTEQELNELFAQHTPQPQSRPSRLDLEKVSSLAQFEYGERLFNGTGVEKNPFEAAKWIKKAAEGKFPLAQFVLGLMYKNGACGLVKNGDLALKWLKLAAGYPQYLGSAKRAISLMYATGELIDRNDDEAIRQYQEFQKLPNNPDARACIAIGKIFYEGESLDGEIFKGLSRYELDQGKAVFWYRKAAELGDLTVVPVS